MKYINKIMSLSLLTLIAVFTSCSSDVDYTPAEKLTNAQVYFPSTNPASYNLNMAEGEQTLNVTIMRANTEGTITVALGASIEAEGNAVSAISLPNSVTFQDGAAEASIPVKYNSSLMGYNNPVQLALSIGDSKYTTPYGVSSYEFTMNVALTWKSLGTGTYIERFVSCLYGVDDLQYEVQVEECEQTPGYYRIVNPYDGKYPYNEDGDWDDSKDYYLEIHAENPNKVYISTQTQATDWGYGNFIVSSLAGYYIAKGTPEKAEAYYGTLKDGFISFGANTLLFGMADYNSGALYSGGNEGLMLALPGYVVADYSVEVEYTGKFEGVESNSIVGNATLGPDVAVAKAVVVQGIDKIQDAYEAIIKGTADTIVEVSTSGEFKVAMPDDAPNAYYTLALVSFDAEGAPQEYAYETFKFINPNLPACAWDLTKPLIGEYDYSLFFGATATHKLTPNGDGTFTLSNWAAGVDFTFKLNEDNSVTFEDQYIGTQYSKYGNVYVYNMTTKAGESYSYYDPEVGTFFFAIDYYVEAGDLTYGYETFRITGEAPTAAKAQGIKKPQIKDLSNALAKKKVNKNRVKLNTTAKMFAD